MSREQVILGLKGFIWLCLGVILFAPLYINSQLFFPYITSKTFAFNIAVELALVAFLALCFFSHQYRLKLTSVVALLAGYIAIVFVSSLLSGHFYHSFWSNHERSEGIVLLLHLLALVVVVTGFFKTMKDWLYAFDLAYLSTLLVSLVAAGQWLQQQFPGSFDFVLKSSTGARLDATIGNPGYVAGYLIFGVFFALLLMFKRPEWQWRVYYGVGIALQLIVIAFTETRGGYLALLAAFPLLCAYFFLWYSDWRHAKLVGVAGIVMGVLLVGGLFAAKDVQFVQDSTVLRRLTSISLSEGTAKNRLLVWQNAWEGFREKPVLGWGYENFYIPFNKNYDADLMEPWFDRSHNMIFDRLLTGGILGLVGYLALLLVPYYFLWRGYRAKKEALRDPRYVVPVVLTLAMMAYGIQNFFIFEALVTYIPLCLLLAFVSTLGPSREVKMFESQTVRTASVVAGVVLLVPIMYFVNIKPLDANAGLIKIFANGSLTVPQRLEAFEYVLGSGTYGVSEFRQQFYQYFDNLARQQVPAQLITPWVLAVERELEAEVRENPTNLQALLSLMSFYNMTGGGQPERFERNFPLYEQAVALSPGRPQVYQTIGYTYFYQALVALEQKNDAEVQRLSDLSLEKMRYAVSLNDENGDSYRHLLTVLLYAERDQEVVDLLQSVRTKSMSIEFEVLVAHARQIAQGLENQELVEQIDAL
jgi:O-antigen ligase